MTIQTSSPENLLTHIIATRLGIGVARATYYDHQTDLVADGLAACLRNQTSRNFSWVVIVDARIPDQQADRLLDIIESANGTLLLFDPVEAGRLLPTAKEIIGEQRRRDNILMTRIDDDDIVCSTFVEQLQSAAMPGVGVPRSSVCLADGLDCYLDEGVYRPYFHPTTPVGISVLSTISQPVSVYEGNHNKMNARAQEAGAKIITVRTERPMWAYIRRGSSDSSEHKKMLLPKNVRPYDQNVSEMIARCGLDADWLSDRRILENSKIDPRPDVIGSGLNRLQIKQALLEMRSHQHTELHREALAAAIYAF